MQIKSNAKCSLAAATPPYLKVPKGSSLRILQAARPGCRSGLSSPQVPERIVNPNRNPATTPIQAQAQSRKVHKLVGIPQSTAAICAVPRSTHRAFAKSKGGTPTAKPYSHPLPSSHTTVALSLRHAPPLPREEEVQWMLPWWPRPGVVHSQQ